MKKVVLLLLLFISISCSALTRYLVSGGTGNWNSTTNWSASSGGGSGASFPVATDDVIINLASANANLTVNVGSACLSITIANTHIGSLIVNQTLTVSGSVTLGSLMGISTSSGTPTLIVNATSILTSNGTTWPFALSFTGTSPVVTVADNWTVGGILTLQGSTSVTLNGNSISCSTSIASNSTLTSGTTNLIMTGTGNLSCAFSSRVLNNNLEINTGGTITIGSALAFIYGGGTLLYTSGTVITTNSTLSINSTCTLTTNGISWNNVTFSGASQTYTLGSDLDVNGTTTLSSSGTPIINGNTIKIGGSLTHSVASTWTGTTTFLIDGTGTWASTSAGCVLRNNLNINTSRTLTIGTLAVYNTGTITYLAGSIAGSGTLTIATSTTLNTFGMTWPNVNLTGNGTLTLNSLLNISGTLTITTVSIVFDGSSGWTTANFVVTTGNNTLKSGLTYTVTSNFSCTGTAANTGQLSWSASPTKAIFILQQGATQDIERLEVLGLDSTAGQTLWTYKGTITTSFNWNILPTQPITITTSN